MKINQTIERYAVVLTPVTTLISILFLSSTLIAILLLLIESINHNATTSKLEGGIFFGFLVLLVLSIVLVLSWKIESTKYQKFLRLILMILSFIFTIYIGLSGAFPLFSSLLSNLDFIELIGLVTFFIYLIILFILSKKEWYPNMMLFIGSILTISSLIYWFYFLSVGLAPDFYTNEFLQHELMIKGTTRLDFFLGIPLMLIYLLYSILLMTLGYKKKMGKYGWWTKLPRYEISAMIGLLIIHSLIWGFMKWI